MWSFVHSHTYLQIACFSQNPSHRFFAWHASVPNPTQPINNVLTMEQTFFMEKHYSLTNVITKWIFRMVFRPLLPTAIALLITSRFNFYSIESLLHKTFDHRGQSDKASELEIITWWCVAWNCLGTGQLLLATWAPYWSCLSFLTFERPLRGIFSIEPVSLVLCFVHTVTCRTSLNRNTICLQQIFFKLCVFKLIIFHL